jgi:hypothetical protein
LLQKSWQNLSSIGERYSSEEVCVAYSHCWHDELSHSLHRYFASSIVCRGSTFPTTECISLTLQIQQWHSITTRVMWTCKNSRRH